jgi:hypothetical protein
MHNAKIYSDKPSSTKPDVPESEIRGSSISRGLDNLGEITMAEPMDWMTPLIHYLENPSHVIDT